MSEPSPKKKETPNPLPRALENGVSVRAVSPMRRVGVPLAIAAALALTTGGAAAYAMSRSKPAEPEREPSTSSIDHSSSTRHSSLSVDVDNVFSRVKEFLTPEPQRPKLAGDVAIAPPPVATMIAPVANPPPTGGAPPAVAPPHDPVRLGGKVSPPNSPRPVTPQPIVPQPQPQPRVAR